VTVENPKEISVVENESTIPPLVCMSLSMKTIMNPQKHLNEIILASAIIHPSISVEGQTTDAEHRFTLSI
jgi:DNA polymerase alpha subunit A